VDAVARPTYSFLTFRSTSAHPVPRY
jgi:hypothetical protein